MSTPEQATGSSGSLPTPFTIWIGRRLHALAYGRALTIATSILFFLVWGPRFARSLWVDEAGTFWMAYQGPIRAIQKTWHWPGQSLLYSAIASIFCFDRSPLRDFLLRIPSLIGIGIAAYFVYRIAERRIGNRAGLVAVILFVFHPGVINVGFLARPYALGMAAVAASCWALDEWNTSRRRIHLLFYTVSAVLVIYLHYFFAVILGVHALYLMFLLLEGRRQRFGEAVLAGACILISVLPLVPHLQLLVGQRRTLPFTGPPSRADLAGALAPSLVVAGLMAAGCLLWLIWPAHRRGRVLPDRAFLFLLTAWWLLGPSLFMVVSKATTMRIFVPRYLSFSYPAQALLFTYLGYLLFDAARARVWALTAVVLFAANPVVAVRGMEGGDELLPVIRLIRAQSKVPVFFPSLLNESQFYDWRAGNQPDSYLFAPLVAYPIANPVLPLPVTPTDEAKEFIGEMVDSRLKATSEVLFVEYLEIWEPWIVDRMLRSGFHATVRTAGNFKLFVFRRD
jgi:Dolichyl-phosphate-mannose-protein mannosyltransferase